MTAQLIDQFLNNPYHSLPRFDAGVHIRAQTNTLEAKMKKNHTQFTLELSNYQVVFKLFERELENYFFLHQPVRFNVSNATVTGHWPRIYISCDDVEVRDAFVESLLNRSVEVGQFIPIFVNASGIKHIKHIVFDSSRIPDQSIVNTAFDWYALSLSHVCFAWRKGFSPLVSTFMQSATRVSMTKPTNKDFKSKILHKNFIFSATFDYVDSVQNGTKKGKKM